MNCCAERIPLACLRNECRLSFVQPAFMHSACHVSIFVFWSSVRLSVARLTHAIASAFETPLAQHALSPANALDAVSIATATRAVVVILIMVKPQTGVVQGLFNLFSYRDPSCHSDPAVAGEESGITSLRQLSIIARDVSRSLS